MKLGRYVDSIVEMILSEFQVASYPNSSLS